MKPVTTPIAQQRLLKAATLFLRADSRPNVGLGHIARSLGLAEAWQRRNGTVHIVVDPDESGLVDPRIVSLIDSLGLAAPRLAGPGPAAGLTEMIGTDADVWIVLDGYDYTADVQTSVRDLGRLLVVDDHCSLGSYDADLVLDQNPDTHAFHYRGVEPGNVLRGEQFTTLRSTAFDAEALTAAPDSAVAFLAGGSPSEQTQQVLRAAIVRLKTRVPVRVIAMPWIDDPDVEHRPFTSTLVDALHGVSCVVAPSGATAWELCALGVPSVLFAVAANQLPVGKTVEDAGAGTFAGSLWAEPPDGIAAHIADAASIFHEDRDVRERASIRGRKLIDGRGADRVLTHVLSERLDLDRVSWSHVDLLFEWANDPIVRASAFNSAQITRDEHELWLSGRLERNGDRNQHWIAHLDAQPIGQIRFDHRESIWEVSVTLDEAARGRGLGSAVIAAGTRQLANALGESHTVIAQVKAANLASMKAFLAAGYKLLGYRRSDSSTPLGSVEVADAETAPDETLVAQLQWDGAGS